MTSILISLALCKLFFPLPCKFLGKNPLQKSMKLEKESSPFPWFHTIKSVGSYLLKIQSRTEVVEMEAESKIALTSSNFWLYSTQPQGKNEGKIQSGLRFSNKIKLDSFLVTTKLKEKH